MCGNHITNVVSNVILTIFQCIDPQPMISLLFLTTEASRDAFPKRSKGGGYDNKAYELDSTRSGSVSSNGSTTGGRSTVVDLRPDHGDAQFGRQRSLKYAYFGQEAYENKAFDSMDTATSSRARYPRGSETSQVNVLLECVEG